MNAYCREFADFVDWQVLRLDLAIVYKEKTEKKPTVKAVGKEGLIASSNRPAGNARSAPSNTGGQFGRVNCVTA